MPDPARNADPRLATVTLDHVRQALTLQGFDALTAQMRMAPQPRPLRRPEAPGQPKLAGVLVLLYPLGSALHFVLIRRAEYNGVHSGQIALPGGRREAGESFEQAALRETCEELGVCADAAIEVLGSLTTLYIPPSDFEVHPVVGYVPEQPAWIPDPTEVAGIIETPLVTILDDAIKGIEDVIRYEKPFRICYYHIQGHKVWGATAIILSELEMRLRSVLALPGGLLPD